MRCHCHIVGQLRTTEANMQLGNENMSITLFDQQPVRRAWAEAIAGISSRDALRPHDSKN